MRSKTSSTRRPVRPVPAFELPEPTRRPSRPADAATRRRGPSRTVLIVSGLALTLLVALGVVAVLTHPTIDVRGPIDLTAEAAPELHLQVQHPGNISPDDVRVTIDGTVVDAEAIDVDHEGGITVQAPRLDDGDHDVRVKVSGAGLTQRTLEASWAFEVDTLAPKARVAAPKPSADADPTYVPAGTVAVTKLPLQVRVATEPGASVRVSSNAQGAPTATADGADSPTRNVAITLPEGAQMLLVRTADAAGNVTERRQRVLVDTTGPALTAKIPRLTKDAALNLPVTVRDTHGATLEVKLNGNVVEGAVTTVSRTEAPGAADAATGGDDAMIDAAAPTIDDAASSDPVLDEDGGAERSAPISAKLRVVLPDGAYEGRHTLELVATDSLGSTTVRKQVLVVDSTEQLAQASGLRAGAKGGDVSQLHTALIEEGIATRAQLLPDIRAKRFAVPTRDAVKRYQVQEGLGSDGVAGSETIAGLTLRIVIDLSAHTLTLLSSGDVVKTYGVAVGAPEFPTPTGDFEIQSMQENPTWTPPDSEWAKDAEVIPPGPDNPLGTRWMGIDGTVGIHGTNNAASIGYSQSHGCIRMRIPDVEELFTQVALGTRVSVVA